MKYARYFCGDLDGVVSKEEYLAVKDEIIDTIDYEPIFDGKVYPTQAESSAAQIAAFGYHYDDDRRPRIGLLAFEAGAKAPWSITDPDACQLQRTDPEGLSGIFEMYQVHKFPGSLREGIGQDDKHYRIAHGHIDLSEYSEDEILDAMAEYGYSERPDSGIIAEMFFEKEFTEYLTSDEYGSLNAALEHLEQKTGMDFSFIKEPGVKIPLYLVTERSATDNSETIFLATARDLFGRSRLFESLSDLEQTGERNQPIYIGRPAWDDSTEYRLRPVDMSRGYEKGIREISEFLFSVQNGSAPEIKFDPMALSDDVRSVLSELMRPVLDSHIAAGRVQSGVLHGEKKAWVDAHDALFSNLANIYSTLGILGVERIRQSVTQGYVNVTCNGRMIASFGDDMWMKNKDGSLSNGFRSVSGKHHGPVIGGWGSCTPDEKFLKGALLRFTDAIYKTMQEEPLRRVEIWQIQDVSDDAVRAMFRSYDCQVRENGCLRPDFYEKVWEGKVQANSLEDIYRIFNKEHPEGYTSRSMSTSDIVKCDDRFYFCDSIGFKQISFEKEPSFSDKLQEAQNTSKLLSADRPVGDRPDRGQEK